MEIIGKSCLMCHKHEGLYKEDNTSVVDQLKLIYGTRNFDDTLKHGHFCLNCTGRIYQLYQFFVIAFHIASTDLPEEQKRRCFACDQKNVIIEIDTAEIVVDFIIQARFVESLASFRKNFDCCYSCFNYICTFNSFFNKLKLFEQLKSHLLCFGTQNKITN